MTRLASISQMEKAFFLQDLQQYFPHLSEEEIRRTMDFSSLHTPGSSLLIQPVTNCHPLFVV